MLRSAFITLLLSQPVSTLVAADGKIVILDGQWVSAKGPIKVLDAVQAGQKLSTRDRGKLVIMMADGSDVHCTWSAIKSCFEVEVPQLKGSALQFFDQMQKAWERFSKDKKEPVKGIWQDAGQINGANVTSLAGVKRAIQGLGRIDRFQLQAVSVEQPPLSASGTELGKVDDYLSKAKLQLYKISWAKTSRQGMVNSMYLLATSDAEIQPVKTALARIEDIARLGGTTDGDIEVLRRLFLLELATRSR